MQSSAASRTIKIAGASLLLLALVWQRIEATRLGYRVESERREAQVLRSRIGAVQMQLETSVSPAQLAAQARARLGMFPAPPESLRILAGDSDASGGSFLTRWFRTRRDPWRAANG